MVANRILVPADARLPQEETGSSAKGEFTHAEALVPRHLIPANARMPETVLAGSSATVQHDLAKSRSLVPANARIADSESGIRAAKVRASEFEQSVFHEALLEGAWSGDQRKAVDWVVSFGVHLVIICTIMVVPLFVTQAINLGQFRYTYLVSPALGAPPVPAPPPPAAAVRPQQTPKPQNLAVPKIIAPMAIPKSVMVPRTPEAPPEEIAGVPGGVVGGVPGGEIGGALGGIVGGTLGSGEPAPPPPPVAAVAAPSAPVGPLRVGGEVQRPHAIFSPQPKYPPLALQAKIQGVVQIDAIIDIHGNVVQMKAISGSGLLIPEAMRAVAQWKYEPTYLNGVPYPVDLTVDVTFHM